MFDKKDKDKDGKDKDETKSEELDTAKKDKGQKSNPNVGLGQPTHEVVEPEKADPNWPVNVPKEPVLPGVNIAGQPVPHSTK